MNEKKNKKIYIPTNKSHIEVLRSVNNPKRFGGIIDHAENFLWDEEEGGRFESMHKEIEGFSIKTDTREQLEKTLKRLSPTSQKAFTYVIHKAIEQGYKNEFEIDINEFLEVLGVIRRTNNIDRLYKSLGAFTFSSFECQTEIWEKDRKGKRKEVKKLKTQGPLLSWVQMITTERKGKRVSIRIRMGKWFEHYKIARENDDVQLMTLPIDCLKVDTKNFPFSFGCPYRMAQHARVNAKKKDDWHVLKLSTIVEGVKPWGDVYKEIKKRGIIGDQSILEKFIRSLEHAEKPFGLQWEWVGKEPTKRSELETAKIKFRFLEPLKSSNKETSTAN